MLKYQNEHFHSSFTLVQLRGLKSWVELRMRIWIQDMSIFCGNDVINVLHILFHPSILKMEAEWCFEKLYLVTIQTSEKMAKIASHVLL